MKQFVERSVAYRGLSRKKGIKATRSSLRGCKAATDCWLLAGSHKEYLNRRNRDALSAFLPNSCCQNTHTCICSIRIRTLVKTWIHNSHNLVLYSLRHGTNFFSNHTVYSFLSATSKAANNELLVREFIQVAFRMKSAAVLTLVSGSVRKRTNEGWNLLKKHARSRVIITQQSSLAIVQFALTFLLHQKLRITSCSCEDSRRNSRVSYEISRCLNTYEREYT